MKHQQLANYKFQCHDKQIYAYRELLSGDFSEIYEKLIELCNDDGYHCVGQWSSQTIIDSSSQCPACHIRTGLVKLTNDIKVCTKCARIMRKWMTNSNILGEEMIHFECDQLWSLDKIYHVRLLWQFRFSSFDILSKSTKEQQSCLLNYPKMGHGKYLCPNCVPIIVLAKWSKLKFVILALDLIVDIRRYIYFNFGKIWI